MITEVYDALLSAGADDGKARRAPEVLADYDTKFASLEKRIDRFEANVHAKFTAVDGRFNTLEAAMNGNFNLLYWMLGILIAAVSALAIRAFV